MFFSRRDTLAWVGGILLLLFIGYHLIRLLLRPAHNHFPVWLSNADFACFLGIIRASGYKKDRMHFDAFIDG